MSPSPRRALPVGGHTSTLPSLISSLAPRARDRLSRSAPSPFVNTPLPLPASCLACRRTGRSVTAHSTRHDEVTMTFEIGRAFEAILQQAGAVDIRVDEANEAVEFKIDGRR